MTLPKISPTIHLNPFNCSNYSLRKQLYTYETIFQDDIGSPRQFNDYDRLVIRKDSRKPYDSCIALTHAFADFEIEKSMLIRPWGPGILFESVFYFLKYCGFSRINIVGLDMKNDNKYNQHFYDENSKKSINPKKLSRIADKQSINYYKHISFIQYNVMNPILFKVLTNLNLLRLCIQSLQNTFLLKVAQCMPSLPLNGLQKLNSQL